MGHGEHRDNALLQRVASMHEVFSLVACVEGRGVLREQEPRIGRIILERGRAHAHLATLLDLLGADHVAALGCDLVAVRARRA
jgi:hypothetical protein